MIVAVMVMVIVMFLLVFDLIGGRLVSLVAYVIVFFLVLFVKQHRDEVGPVAADAKVTGVLPAARRSPTSLRCGESRGSRGCGLIGRYM